MKYKFREKNKQIYYLSVAIRRIFLLQTRWKMVIKLLPKLINKRYTIDNDQISMYLLKE
jgi:hypothetical protein